MYFFRFDDRAARHARNESREGPIPFDEQDLPIRMLMNHIQETAHQYYTPSRLICIDEGLVQYNGNCGLKVYEPSKPGSRGIKMYLLCDTKTHYTHYIEMYRKGGPALYYSGEKVVERLINGARIGRGHAPVAHRFYTSASLARTLLQRGITYTGTCVHRRRFIPRPFAGEALRYDPDMGEMVSKIIYADNMSPTGYVPRRHFHRNFKVVLILSTEYQLSQQVNYYNSKFNLNPRI